MEPSARVIIVKINRISSKTNSSLKLQTSNSLLWGNLGRLKITGESPTDFANKIVLHKDIHNKVVSPWWFKLQKQILKLK